MTDKVPLTAEEIASYEDASGRTQTEAERLDADVEHRFAATLGDEPFDDPSVLPLGRQWAFFLPRPTRSGTGPDGHPKRGGFIPAIRLERRMFAGGTMQRTGDLALNQETEKTTTIKSVSRKDGAAGEMIFVETESVFVQGGQPALTEKQSIVYLNPGAAQALPTAGGELPTTSIMEDWTPDTVDLFRFSAVTYNGHRIHYDQPYATSVEGYPALIVHGPLIASKLLDLAMRTRRANATSFSFRARMPAFVNQPLRLLARESEGGFVLEAVRVDGKAAMTAEVGFA